MAAKKPGGYEDFVDGGFPGLVKDTYDEKLRQTAKAVNNAGWAVAGSGFGKGALLTALVTVTGLALTGWGCFGSPSSGISPFGMGLPPERIGGALNENFNNGVRLGAQIGIDFLKSTHGLLTLGLGGVVGAVADLTRSQRKLEADMAALRAASRKGVSPEKSLEPEIVIEPKIEPKLEMAPEQANPEPAPQKTAPEPAAPEQTTPEIKVRPREELPEEKPDSSTEIPRLRKISVDTSDMSKDHVKRLEEVEQLLSDQKQEIAAHNKFTQMIALEREQRAHDGMGRA